MQFKIYKQLFFLLLNLCVVLLVSCGGNANNSDSSILADETSNDQIPNQNTNELATFTKFSEKIESQLTSTCTIIDDGIYKMYRLDKGNIALMTSTDGATFSQSQNVGISNNAGTYEDFIRNPAVIKLTNGQYVLIYEGMDTENNPKLFRATSSNGSTFTKYQGSLEDGAILEPNTEENNFMSVPDLLEINGTLHMYYVANKKRIFHATSVDEGITWDRKGEITLIGVDNEDKTVDPDVIQLHDGSFRLFFAYSLGTTIFFGKEGVHSAISQDGHVFDYKGKALEVQNGEFTLDPDVVEIIEQPNIYRMYFGLGSSSSNIDLYSADTE